MLELTTEAVTKFWAAHQDPLVAKIVSFMESIEDWTLDGEPAFEQAVTELLQTLDKTKNLYLPETTELIQITAALKFGRALLLLQYMDSKYPGIAVKALTSARELTQIDNSGLVNEQSPTPTNDSIFHLFVRRNLVFERLRLLARIFATERLTQLTNIITEQP